MIKSFLDPRFLYLLLLWTMVPAPAAAQGLAEGLQALSGGDASWSARIIQMLGLLTVLSLAPGILIMVTCFTRIVVVLSLLRTALGLNQTPPNMVLISLALFLTAYVMQPAFDQAWNEGLQPLLEEEIAEEEAIKRMGAPFFSFMLANVRDKDLQLFIDLAPETVERPEAREEVGWRVLIPAFMLSELRRAFEIGFLIFLPFLVIDIVVASILMSMGMMMLPPVMISLPFKIIFFVLIDGWYLLAGSLARSFGG